MKKTFVLLMILSVIFILAGCQEKDTVAPVIKGAVDIVYTIGDDIPDYTSYVTASDDIDGSVEVNVDATDISFDVTGTYPLIYGAVDASGNEAKVVVDFIVIAPDVDQIHILVKNLDGSIAFFRNIPFESLDIPIIDLMETQVSIDYTAYDFGLLINGIGNIYPPEYGASYNYYFQIYKDNTLITSSLDEQTYQDGTIFTFQIVTALSEFDLAVDHFIYNHIDMYKDQYIQDGSVDYNVLSALYKFNQKGYISLDVTTLYNYGSLNVTEANYEDLSIGDLLKLSIYMKVEMLDTTSLEAYVQILAADNAYSLANLLNLYTVLGLENETFAQSLMNEDFLDSDFIGMSYQALAPYTDLINFNDYIADSTTYILTQLTETGVSSWGTPNASSTAQLIVGLIHQGLNPEAELYQVNGQGLVELLLGFEQEGYFLWSLDMDSVDLSFSSPQAFTALILYKLARDVYGFPPTYLYEIN